MTKLSLGFPQRHAK